LDNIRDYDTFPEDHNNDMPDRNYDPLTTQFLKFLHTEGSLKK